MERAGIWKAFYLYSKKSTCARSLSLRAWLLADLLLISRMEEEQNSMPGQTKYIGISAVVQHDASS